MISSGTMIYSSTVASTTSSSTESRGSMSTITLSSTGSVTSGGVTTAYLLSAISNTPGPSTSASSGEETVKSTPAITSTNTILISLFVVVFVILLASAIIGIIMYKRRGKRRS